MALLGTGTAGALVGGCGTSKDLAPLPTGSRVVVIGAGFAGVAAAERLIEAGYDLVHLEASRDIGGRVRTESLGGYPVDMGAGWLHDSRANRLRETAEALRFDLYPTDLNRGLALDGSAAPVPFGDMADVFEAVEEAATGTYLSWRFRRAFGLRPSLPALASVVGSALSAFGPRGCAALELVRTAYASDPSALSAGVLFEGDDETLAAHTPLPSDDVIVGTGMLSLLRALARQTQPSFGEPCLGVARVPDGVRVRTPRRTVEADAVIVTASLGVLKSGAIEFSPALPPAHTSALDRLGFGSFEKVWLEYPEGSWQSNAHVLTVCDRGPFGFVVDFSGVSGRPLVLGASAGDRTDALSAMGLNRSVEALHGHVRHAVGVNVPEPIGTVVSDWSNDPWVRGAYMYPTVGAQFNERAILRRPIGRRIFLAGEALSPTRFGLVDGAWEDGRRAANLVVRGSENGT